LSKLFDGQKRPHAHCVVASNVTSQQVFTRSEREANRAGCAGLELGDLADCTCRVFVDAVTPMVAIAMLL